MRQRVLLGQALPFFRTKRRSYHDHVRHNGKEQELNREGRERYFCSSLIGSSEGCPLGYRGFIF